LFAVQKTGLLANRIHKAAVPEGAASLWPARRRPRVSRGISFGNRFAVSVKNRDMRVVFYTPTQPPWAASFGYRNQVALELGFVYRGLWKPPIGVWALFQVLKKHLPPSAKQKRRTKNGKHQSF
jgi:hypothetical protein